MSDAEPYELERFVLAQRDTIDRALEELRVGRKRTHWMWFVFPQLLGLGRSEAARYYGIGSIAEARAYLDHPLLGERLARCTRLAIANESRSLEAIFGHPDDRKFHSSMTLFARASRDADRVYERALERLCGGRHDEATLALLEPRSSDCRLRW